MKTSIDDIASYLPNINIKVRSRPIVYIQKMQTRFGGICYSLKTVSKNNTVQISLYDDTRQIHIGTRNVSDNEENIKKAIKSLERKAGKKLYYVLLIDTDGEYL